MFGEAQWVGHEPGVCSVRDQSQDKLQVAWDVWATGFEGLVERSRARRSQARVVSAEVMRELTALRQGHPFLGPRKLVAALRRVKLGVSWPPSRTAREILKRHGLGRGGPRRRWGLGVWCGLG